MTIQKGMYIEDRYEILEKIGSGGMSDVYKARCHKLNRFVAIKFLKPEYCEDKNFVKNFQIEAQSAAALLHPNVVSVYDVNQTEGIYYIVMEYVDGITLKKYISRNGRLPVKEATSIAIQIAQGIDAAHNAHIIHRDIKPQNVLISREGKIKVTDFGIARTTTANTISTDILGSVQYISPEQARGGQVDNRTDIYSFGIVYFEMITGRLPFDGDSTVAIALKHIQENVPLASDVVDGVPSSVSRIIEKCTQRKPERRYQKTSSLLADLKTSLITPNEDFVVLEPEPSESATIIMSGDDAEMLRREGNKALKRSPRSSSGMKSGTGKLSGSSVRKHASQNRRREHYRDYDDDDFDEFEDYDERYDDRYRAAAPRKKPQSRNKKQDRRYKKKRSGDRALVVFGILAGLIIAGVLIFVAVKSFGNNNCAGRSVQLEPQTTTAQPETVLNTETVPSVIGMQVSRAQTDLENLGFVVKVKYAHSDSIAREYVIEQSVKNGTSMEKGQEITLTVSSGQETVKLSEYSGQDADAVVAALEKQGFKTRITEQYDETVPEGSVIETNPVSGSEVALDAEIELIVSLGPESITVLIPDVAWYSEAGAADLLNQYHLYGYVTYEEVAGWGGYAMYTYPAAGSEVEEWSWVNIVVGTEPQTEAPVVVPVEEPTEPAAEEPSDTQTDPADTQTDPADTQTDPADTQTDPADTQTDPADTQTDPADTQTDPADTQTDPADTQTDPPVTPEPPADQGADVVEEPEVPEETTSEVVDDPEAVS